MTKSMGLNKSIHDFYSHSYISLRNGYFFHSVGKAANSTVKHFLYLEEARGTRFKYDSVHDRRSSPLLSPFQLPQERVLEIMKGSEFFKFTFVRNPYSRLLSCYLDRIVPKRSTPYRELVRYLNKSVGYDVSFPEFVSAICAQSDFEQNNHWRLQYADAMCDIVNYDYIGKQESFKEDMEYVWRHIFPKSKVPDFAGSNLSPSRTSSSQKVDDYWTKDLKDQVGARYSKDFEFFGYF